MKKIILILFLTPILCDGQLKISVDIIERTDTKKEFKQNINISLSKNIYKNIETGITNRKSLADYINEGQTPIQDSIKISNYQIFAKYHFENNLFFTLISPITNYNNEIKLVDRIRIGGGYIFQIEKENNCNLYLGYDVLLSQNKNGWRKGVLKLGFSIDLL